MEMEIRELLEEMGFSEDNTLNKKWAAGALWPKFPKVCLKYPQRTLILFIIKTTV